MQQIYKIVITGGPCAGKTTALSTVKDTFTKKGYTVLTVGEMATELINSGIAPWTCANNIEYQKCQMKLQLEKEAVFLKAARTMNARKILMICDRGMHDNKAYMGETAFLEMVRSLGKTEEGLLASYDAVFHLSTAAKGAEEAYTLSNNSARTENIEQARDVDDRVLDAWKDHPCRKIIDNSTSFEEKISRLIFAMDTFFQSKDADKLDKSPEMSPAQFLDILKRAEKLKENTRHNWINETRKESVADHSWRITLMAMLLNGMDEFKDVDMDRVIKMCLIHDLGEAFTGDIPTFKKSEKDAEKEDDLFDSWVDKFPLPQKDEWKSLLTEMRELSTTEAKIYKALDKLEAVIAHNEADIRSWLPLEKDLQLTYAVEATKFSTYLTDLREQVDEWTRKKIDRGDLNDR